MMVILNVIALIVAGLMVGSELAIAAFVHPTLDRLPDNVHLPVVRALARVQGPASPLACGAPHPGIRFSERGSR